MCHGLAEEGIPMLDIWDVLDPEHEQRTAKKSRGRPDQTLVVYEDNQAAIQVATNGKSGAMRHVARTHRVNLDWLTEVINKALCTVMYVSTKCQAADIFTKSFPIGPCFLR